MKLTGNLKNQVENAESKDEKKSLIENAGMEPTDEDVNVQSGLMELLGRSAELKRAEFGIDGKKQIEGQIDMLTPFSTKEEPL